MKYNGTTVPNYRDDTYNKDEVHRKSADELYDTAFNEDQQKVLDNFEPSGGGSLPEVTTEDNGDILTVVDGEWEKAEPGYKCSETSTTLTEESVTTSGSAPYIGGDFSYSSLIDADTITVTFNGTEYEADKIDYMGSNIYGGFAPSGPDFSEYPFAIMSTGSANTLYTENAGTYNIKITTTSGTIETSECFKKAVESIAPQELVYVHFFGSSVDMSDVEMVEDYTGQELIDLMNSGKTIIGIMTRSRMWRTISIYVGVHYDVGGGTPDGFEFGFMATWGTSYCDIFRQKVDLATNTVSLLGHKAIVYDN